MNYPVLIHKDTNSDYGVTVPDLPGCFSAGETLDNALLNVVEAIECHLEGILLDGESIPPVNAIEEHRNDPAYQDGIWAFVTIDMTKLSGNTRRVNITIPERVLNVMDKFAADHNQTRSGLIMEAALEYIASRQNK